MRERRSSLFTIADRYGRVITGVGLLIVANILFMATVQAAPIVAVVAWLAALAIVIYVMVNACQLSSSLGWTFLPGLLTLLPLINLVVLLVMSSAASRRLKAAGVTVGLFGVPRDEVRGLRGQAVG